MKIGYVFAAAATTALVSGCTDRTEPMTGVSPKAPTVQGDATYDAFMAFADEAFTMADASEADLSGLVAALPDYASLTWDEKSFDAASGATVFDGLSIGFGEDAKFGLVFDEARVWGLETDLLTARLQGERLDESGPLLTRLEGTNASYFGVATAINSVLNGFLVNIDEDFPETFELSVDQLESTTERVVVAGVSLRPWELSLLSPEDLGELSEEIPEEVSEIAHVAQQLIAIGRSISIDQSVSIGTVASVEMRQTGATTSMDYSMAFSGAIDIRGFDVGSNIARGVSSSQTDTFSGDLDPDELIAFSPFPAGFALIQTENYASASISNLRLDKLMGYLARSELPGMDERDLMSFGRWELTDYRAQLNDSEILTADRAYFNADSFEWILPSDLNFGVTGATLNTGELTGFFQILFETFLDGTAEDAGMMTESDREQMELVREGVQKAINLLPEHGLDKLPFDAAFAMTWDGDAGDSDFSARFDADGFGETIFELGLTLPDYTALRTAYEAEVQSEQFEAIFEDMFAFRGGRFLEVDKGGYDKLFGFAHALGKEYPNEGWGAMLGGMEPAQLRTYLGTMIRMAKGPASEEFPPAAEWIESYASYLESGGQIEFLSAPPRPINAALIEEYDDEEPEPEEIVEMLGLMVTHTK